MASKCLEKLLTNVVSNTELLESSESSIKVWEWAVFNLWRRTLYLPVLQIIFEIINLIAIIICNKINYILLYY